VTDVPGVPPRSSNDDSDWGVDFDPRSDARERAMNVLYEADIRGITPAEVMTAIVVPFDDLTRQLIDGTTSALAAIDALLSDASHSWPLHRMPTIDRAILRMATYELLERGEVPVAVVIDEAVTLAKRFSTDNSGSFVNGVLSAVASRTRA
jgi:N utilization substance protein B